MGFKEHMIEDFGQKKIDLKMWNGSASGQKANIRIKGNGWSGQNYVGGLRNDMGFDLQADGTYSIQVDQSGEYGKTWMDKFNKAYSKEVVKEVCQEQNFFLSSEEEVDGELVLKLSTPF